MHQESAMAEHTETLTFVGTIFAGVSGLAAGIGAALHSRGVQRELGEVKARIDGVDKDGVERRDNGRRFEDRILAEMREDRRIAEIRDQKYDRLFGELFRKVEDGRVEIAELRAAAGKPGQG